MTVLNSFVRNESANTDLIPFILFSFPVEKPTINLNSCTLFTVKFKPTY